MSEGQEKKLTGKQQRFIAEYLVDLNATQAAIRAGYSKKTAFVVGHENLRKPYIQEALLKAREAQEQRTQIKADDVLRELYRLASFDPRKLFNADGSPKDITELDDDTAACIGGIDIVERITNAEEGELERIKKLKIWDKNRALENLGKHFALFVERQEHTGKNGDPIKVDNAMDQETVKQLVESIMQGTGNGEPGKDS